jgi:hypothetical protein
MQSSSSERRKARAGEISKGSKESPTGIRMPGGDTDRTEGEGEAHRIITSLDEAGHKGGRVNSNNKASSRCAVFRILFWLHIQ